MRATTAARGATLAVAGAIALALASAPASSSGAAYTPPGKKIWHGVSDTGHAADYRRFNKQVRAHTALNQVFFHWGVPLTTGAFQRWEATDTRGVLSLSTAPGDGAEVTTPRRIARGYDDQYMVKLNGSIDNFDQVVYIRPFGEMNLHYNPYSAFNADGSRRPGHSTRAFKLAWKRLAIIVRGGKRRGINARLLKLGMPRIHRATAENDPIYQDAERAGPARPAEGRVHVDAADAGVAERPGQLAARLLAGGPLRGLGRHGRLRQVLERHAVDEPASASTGTTAGYPFAIGEYARMGQRLRRQLHAPRSITGRATIAG